MTSKPSHLFVWIWLPGAKEPVVAGRLEADGQAFVFNYGRSYLERPEAIPLHLTELPLQSGAIPNLKGLTIPGCLRDGSPDAWGRRVILSRNLGTKGEHADTVQIDELTYMLASGSDRIGALDFQTSSENYVPRMATKVTLVELQSSAERVEKGIPLTPELDQALHHGSSIGGARPKALIEANSKKYVAKFSASADLYNVVKAEFVAMRLAALAGLSVAPVNLVRSSHKDVLLVERFDRVKKGKNHWNRHAMISALTLLKLDEMMARYASYEDLANIVRYEFANPKRTLRELFGRIVFNVLSGNTDDHARNHAALWDGKELSLTPAYDICPQPRSGGEATQAMLIKGNDRSSRIATCLAAAPVFQLAHPEAINIVSDLVVNLGKHWHATCNAGSLNVTDRRLLAGRQFLNPYAFEGLNQDASFLVDLASQIRQRL